jgi:HAD superfamily hydrolase (TIGR01484 family)
MVLCGEKEIYYTDSNEVVRDFLDRFGADYKEVSSYYRVADEILEAVFISENKHKLQDIRKKFSFPWSFGIVSTLSNSVSERGMYYLELRKKGSTKAKGVKKIMKRSGLKLNDIAVVGDWYNDIELFDMGAFTAAPANAVAEIANKASFVASKPNTEDGISEFFELLLNHK